MLIILETNTHITQFLEILYIQIGKNWKEQIQLEVWNYIFAGFDKQVYNKNTLSNKIITFLNPNSIIPSFKDPTTKAWIQQQIGTIPAEACGADPSTGEEFCEITYLPLYGFVWVEDNNGNTSSNGEGTSSNGTPGGSNTGGGVNAAIIDFSFASFAFTNTSIYFQEAGVRGIRIKIIDSRNSYAKSITMPTLVFGLPTFLEPWEAAEFAASCVNLASDQVFGLYRSGTMPNDPVIQNYFIETLRSKLSIKGRTVQRYGMQSDSRINIRDADYDLFGSGNCN